MRKWEILYEDNEVIVVRKPAGLDSQESRGIGPDMVSELRRYLMTGTRGAAGTPGKAPYIGVVHRLDRQVSGILVYAKTKRAAAFLSSEIRGRRFRKVYYAVVCGVPEGEQGIFKDALVKDPGRNYSRTAEPGKEAGSEAELSWQKLETADDGGMPLTLLRILLGTGRHHQIRVQFSSRGLPLWGDVKYNPAFAGQKGVQPALCAAELGFSHPVTGKQMSFRIRPEGEPFARFGSISGGKA